MALSSLRGLVIFSGTVEPKKYLDPVDLTVPSPSMNELITLISKQAAIQKDVIKAAKKAKIRLPVEVLQAEVQGVEA